MKKWIASLGLTLALGIAEQASAAELAVQVVGLRSTAGDVHIAVYDSADDFPKRGRFVATAQIPTDGDMATWHFAGLAPGRYAIAVYHDENSNDSFDKGFLGLPLEDFGFSNDAPVFLGPPSFEDAAVKLSESSEKVVIRLNDDDSDDEDRVEEANNPDEEEGDDGA